MSKIQLLAFETSGLKPKTDRILEVGIATFDTRTGDIEAESFLLDPGNADLSDEIVAFHTKSGLLPELIEAASAGKLVPWEEIHAPAAHLRVTWARDFVAPFFAEPHTQIGLGGAVQGSMSFDTLRSVASALLGIETPAPAQSRVSDKLLIMLQLVKALRAGAQ